MSDDLPGDEVPARAWIKPWIRRRAIATVLSLALLGVIGAGLIAVRTFAVTSIEIYEVGYKFNRWTGNITVFNHKGWAFYIPIFEVVNTIDLRPYQVCLNANKRVLNCKLVTFNPEGLKLFISWHGRANYDGGSDEPGDFKDILRSYALSGSSDDYPFLTVQNDLKSGVKQ